MSISMYKLTVSSDEQPDVAVVLSRGTEQQMKEVKSALQNILDEPFLNFAVEVQ